ncbi:methyltransferase [Plakobranchus ocellatus]|uniref:Methyltransferase n=1 Tax=Plakobranchus ocellatus TaxID=259542 RepID=A0AAV4BXC8_9GAST|nr:methyltransferase [Plakobranchus ocellatus]
MPHGTAPHRTMPHCIAQHAPHRTTQHRIAPHRTSQHRIAPTYFTKKQKEKILYKNYVKFVGKIKKFKMFLITHFRFLTFSCSCAT